MFVKGNGNFTLGLGFGKVIILVQMYGNYLSGVVMGQGGLIRGLGIRQSGPRASFTSSFDQFNKISGGFALSTSCTRLVIGALRNYILGDSSGLAILKENGFGVLKASSGVGEDVPTRSLIGAFGLFTRGLGSTIIGRGSIRGVYLASGIYGGYIRELIMCVLKEAGLLSCAIIRGGGAITRNRDLFLVVDGVCGYFLDFLLSFLGLGLRALARFGIGDARELIGRGSFKVTRGHSYGYGALLLAT